MQVAPKFTAMAGCRYDVPLSLRWKTTHFKEEDLANKWVLDQGSYLGGMSFVFSLA